MPVPSATVTQYYTGIFRQAPTAAVSAAYQAMPTANDALNSMLSAANSQVDPIVRLYQTAFNRVPDSAGMTAWVTAFTAGAITTQQIANGFTQSTEFTTLYPASMSNSQFVGALYWNILQRQGEAAGINGWVNALNSGALTRAQVLVGFSDSAEYIARIEPNVNAFLTAAANNTQTYTGNLFDQGTGSAVSHDLTTGADSPNLTAANDIINGAVTSNGQLTWQTWDTLNGGAGNDVLNAGMNNNTVLLTNVSSIETFNIDVTGAAATINAVVANYIQNLTVTDSVGFTINSLGSVPNISLTGTGATTINFDASALAPAAQTLTLTLNSKTAGAITITDNGSNALETISIVSSGSANTIGGLTTFALGTTTLNVSGSQNITLGAITDANATLTTINASTLTGSMSVTALASSSVTGGSGNDTITSGGGNDSFVGGSGNDTFVMGSTLTTADTITGGTGTDTLSTNVAAVAGLSASSAYANVSGVETLTIADATGANTITTKYVSADINRVNLTTATGAANTTLALSAGAQTVAFTSAASTITAGQTLTVTSDGTATTDSLTLTVAPSTAVAQDYIGSATSGITTTGFETVAINTGTFTNVAATTQNIGALNVGSGNAITVSGSNTLAIAAGLVANSLDASALASAAVLTMGGAATNIGSIIGTARADTIVGDSSSSIDGGAGNDTLTGGSGNDTILGGDGADSITGNGGVDSILGGAGNDTVIETLTTGNVIDGGADTDTLVLAAAATAATGAGVRNFEILSLTGAGLTQDMTLFVDNGVNTWTRVNVVGNVTETLTNVGSGVTTVGFTSTGTLGGFTRLVDTATDALTLNVTSGSAVASVTANTENTISIVSATATGDATVTTLVDTQLTTLNIGTAGTSTGNFTVGTITAASLATINVNNTGTVSLGATANSSASNITVNASTASAATIVGGSGADSVTGTSGVDSLSGGSGNDTISSSGGADVITGGTGADSLTGGTGADTFKVAIGDSVAATVNGLTAGGVVAGNTLTFGNGVDVITDFTAGTGGDVLANTTTATTALTAGLGVATNAFTTTTTAYYLSGTYNASTKVFTVAANGAGADTAIVEGAATGTYATVDLNATFTILVGVNSANLVAANFA